MQDKILLRQWLNFFVIKPETVGREKVISFMDEVARWPCFSNPHTFCHGFIFPLCQQIINTNLRDREKLLNEAFLPALKYFFEKHAAWSMSTSTVGAWCHLLRQSSLSEISKPFVDILLQTGLACAIEFYASKGFMVSSHDPLKNIFAKKLALHCANDLNKWAHSVMQIDCIEDAFKKQEIVQRLFCHSSDTVQTLCFDTWWERLSKEHKADILSSLVMHKQVSQFYIYRDTIKDCLKEIISSPSCLKKFFKVLNKEKINFYLEVLKELKAEGFAQERLDYFTYKMLDKCLLENSGLAHYFLEIKQHDYHSLPSSIFILMLYRGLSCWKQNEMVDKAMQVYAVAHQYNENQWLFESISDPSSIYQVGCKAQFNKPLIREKLQQLLPYHLDYCMQTNAHNKKKNKL